MWLRLLQRSLIQFIFSEVVMRFFPCLIVFSLVVTAWEVQAQTSRADSAASYTYRGNEWFTKGELDLAIADYNLAIAFDPRSAVAFINRGRIWELKGYLDRALTDIPQQQFVRHCALLSTFFFVF